VLGRRKSITKHGRQVSEIDDLGKESSKESTVFVVLGTTLLWFGWFGFNAGSALAASGQSVLALINTNIATAAAMLTFYALERLSGKKSSVIGMCVGAVCGLVGITPACGYVPIYASGIIGAFSSIATFTFYKCMEKCRYRPDDRLGVFGCHGVSGITGSILIGFFAEKEVGATLNGIFQGGGGHLLGVQIAGVCCTFIWSVTITFILLLIINAAGLYKVIDEENEKENNDFDEQAVFLPNIEKMIAMYGLEKSKGFEAINQKEKVDKLVTQGQVVISDRQDGISNL
jgi:Amt family ammonium transporter